MHTSKGRKNLQSGSPYFFPIPLKIDDNKFQEEEMQGQFGRSWIKSMVQVLDKGDSLDSILLRSRSAFRRTVPKIVLA
jgi:hypothetical protein